jgi:F0F1-type ATP synthase gamma subunit
MVFFTSDMGLCGCVNSGVTQHEDPGSIPRKLADEPSSLQSLSKASISRDKKGRLKRIL